MVPRAWGLSTNFQQVLIVESHNKKMSKGPCITPQETLIQHLIFCLSLCDDVFYCIPSLFALDQKRSLSDNVVTSHIRLQFWHWQMISQSFRLLPRTPAWELSWEAVLKSPTVFCVKQGNDVCLVHSECNQRNSEFYNWFREVKRSPEICARKNVILSRW